MKIHGEEYGAEGEEWAADKRNTVPEIILCTNRKTKIRFEKFIKFSTNTDNNEFSAKLYQFDINTTK